MTTDSAPRREGPVALSALFDDALQKLAPAPGPAAPARGAAPQADAFLYSGNRHESVPRRLFLDRRLTPLERNAWQVFRLQLNDDGVTAFPTYDQLRPYLASMPCAAQASHETVARALTLLRLTRWLSLVRRRRDPKTGRILGNLYVLHDEPLTPFEAMQLDPDYLGLVNQALTHAAKAVQIVGVQTLKEIAEDPMLSGRTLPTRLQVLAQQYRYSGATRDDFASKNAVARTALEKFGELPQDVLEGTRRSRFAPPIARRGNRAGTPAAHTNADADTSTDTASKDGAADSARGEDATE